MLALAGGIALAIGLFLSTLSVRDYFVRLRMFPTWVEIVDTGNNTALVLFRLSFVNMSSRGRVVRDMLIEQKGVKIINRLSIVRIAEPHLEIDLAHQTATYSIPNVSRKLPFDETLLPCLDIPPYQSQSRWVVFAVQYDKENDVDELNFVALGTRKRPREVARARHQLHMGKSLAGPINLYFGGVAGKSVFADD